MHFRQQLFLFYLHLTVEFACLEFWSTLENPPRTMSSRELSFFFEISRLQFLVPTVSHLIESQTVGYCINLGKPQISFSALSTATQLHLQALAGITATQRQYYRLWHPFREAMTLSEASNPKMHLSFILAPAHAPSSHSNLIDSSPVQKHGEELFSPKARHTCNCGKAFNRSLHYLYHVSSEASANCDVQDSDVFPCEVRGCKSAFRQKSDRAKHVSCVHRRMRPFKCKFAECQSAFFLEKDSKKHYATVHLNERPWVCSRCGQAFGKKEHLNNHVNRIHLLIKPYGCNVCGVRMASKHNLQYHTKTSAHLQAVGIKRKEKQWSDTGFWKFAGHFTLDPWPSEAYT